MKNDIGKMIRRVLLVLLVLLAIACRLAAGALAGSAWDWYAAWRGLPLEAVGSQAESDDPRARSIADMEEMDLFAVEQVQEWDEAEYFHLIRTSPTWQSDAYCVLTLESGERVAARCSTEGSVYDGYTDVWTSPVGQWVPWELTEIERAQVEEQDLNLTTVDYYADMAGEARILAYDRFQSWYPWAGTLALWVLVVVLVLLSRLLLWPRREVNRARNDVEKWLAGTHAIWGQDYAQLSRVIPGKRPFPTRFGGVPCTLFTRWMVRSTLKTSWDITSYEDLLDTVTYMSRGPGFTNCSSQAARAWQLCRCSSLLGMAMVAGWASRRELVDRSREIGRQIQATFSSWEDLGLSFLEGYTRWRQSEGGDILELVQGRVDIYHRLMSQKNGPYQLPWDLDLDGKK